MVCQAKGGGRSSVSRAREVGTAGTYGAIDSLAFHVQGGRWRITTGSHAAEDSRVMVDSRAPRG